MAGQQQQGGGGGGGDNSLDFLWLIVMVMTAIIGAWYFGRVYIVSAIYFIRYYEVMLINYFLGIYLKVASKLGLPFPDTTDLVNSLSAIYAGPSKDMGFGIVAAVSNAVGWYLSFPIAIVLCLLAFIILRSNVGARFKRIHSMPSLRNSELELWPMIAPVAKLDLVNQDINKGPWAMSVTPMMFAKKYDLLKVDNSVNPPTATIKKGAATRAFSIQLGKFYRGAEHLSPPTQAILAICMARACRDRAAADPLMTQLSRSAAMDKIDYTGTKEIIAKYINEKPMRVVMSRHAYVLTMMASILELARTDGVFATSEFLWLKPVDRPLWYILNSVGRQTPFPEVSGIYAHWLVEKKLQRPLRIPMVDQAVVALDVSIKDILFEADEEL